MSWLQNIATAKFLVFTLILVRTSGMMVVAPPLGSVAVPVRVRGLLAVVIALVMAQSPGNEQAYLPTTMVDLLVVIGGELLVGITLGVGILVMFSAMHLAGQLMGTVSGMQAADIFNPTTETSMPLFAQALDQIGILVYLLIGGHRMALGGLLDTFVTIPAGTGTISDSTFETLMTITSQSLALGVRVAAPVVVAMLLTTLVMGLVSRTMPQLNILLIGFGTNMFVSFGALAFALGGMVWLIQGQFDEFLRLLVESVPAAWGEGSAFENLPGAP